MGYDVKFTPIVGMNVKYPRATLGSQVQDQPATESLHGYTEVAAKLVVDQINQELAAALTKLQETEEQVKTAKENKELAEENLDLITFSYNEGKANMVDVLSAQLSWTQAHTSLINAYLAEKMAGQNTERLSANKRKLYFIQTEALFRVNRLCSYIRSLYSAKS